MRSVFGLLLCLGTVNLATPLPYHWQNGGEKPARLVNMRGFVEGDTGTTDWWATGQEELNKYLHQTLPFGVAKNLILFVGDGMGLSTTTAARIYKAQSRGLMGEDALLSFEKFNHVGLSKVYNTDSQVPDSAGTATAFLCGEKAKRGTVGMSQHVARGDCEAETQPGNKLKSILKHAMDAGKLSGFVGNVRVTHATLSTTYANSADRSWESDGEQEGDLNPDEMLQCPDIAKQLVDGDYGKNIRVILGGGREMFYPEGFPDPEYPDDDEGTRLDGRDLTQDWIKDKLNRGWLESQVKYVMNQTEFDKVDPNEVDFLMGLFEPSHMQYDAERFDPDIEGWGEPSLTEMTEKALSILQRAENGYFLLVEGGRIDLAHHGNKAMNALNETASLSDAVEKALSMTDAMDTLIVVTADHSHPFNINGYPSINNDILGAVDDGVDSEGNPRYDEMDDDKPYFTLSYTNGRGYEEHRWDGNEDDIPRKDITDDIQNGLSGVTDYRYDAAMPRSTATHDGTDVAIYAHGPMAHMFTGSHEQHYIPHVMMYAACIGPNTDHCDLPWDYPAYCPPH